MFKAFLLGILFSIIVAAAAVYAVVTTGAIPASAVSGPIWGEDWVASTDLDAVLAKDAPKGPNPVPLTDANLIVGIDLFGQHCAICHGTAKGDASATPIAKGEWPKPPQLASEGVEDDPEGYTFWKVKNGIRWSGMPAHAGVLSDEQIWTLALFLKHMDKPRPPRNRRGRTSVMSSRAGQAGCEENAMRADYVIIGAGSAGCVLANRLSADPGTRVVLLEAGGRDWNPLIHIPAGYMKLMDHPSLTWGFTAEPDPGVNGRAILYPRGRVLGGSSSINGMIYVRGQPEDFDHWGQLGNRGWSWDDVLPYFKIAEDWEGGADEFHGQGGPLLTSRTADQPFLCQKLIEAGTEIGLEYREDVNHLPPGAGDCIGWVQQTRRGRRRQSAARTYLRPALKRPNLQVVTNALVHRILLDGTRAVGVEYARGDKLERVDAAREVILAAGAIGSPHVLQLSGVGDPDHLGRVGIPVRRALPGVGKNLQDHYLARVTCVVTGAKTLNEKSRGLPFAGEVLRYLFAGTGMLTYAASLVAASVKVLEESATPDVQCLLASGSFAPGPIRRLDDKPGMTAGIWQMRPLSRGYVEARSNRPADPPAINPRYLSEETDRRAMVGGLRMARRLFAAPALKKYVVAENLPGDDVQSDDKLLDYARQYGSTVFHATCTCKMGPDAMAVVDDRLRVHGLQGLRVIDASVMPTVTSTNTNAPTIMIAEKGAAMILEEARQRLAA